MATSALSTLQTNLQKSVELFSTNSKVKSEDIYLQEDGSAYVCANIVSRVYHMICDYFWNSKMTIIASVYERTALEYLRDMTSIDPRNDDLTPKRVSQWKQIDDVYQARLQFLARAMEANGEAFKRYTTKHPESTLHEMEVSQVKTAVSSMAQNLARMRLDIQSNSDLNQNVRSFYQFLSNFLMNLVQMNPNSLVDSVGSINDFRRSLTSIIAFVEKNEATVSTSQAKGIKDFYAQFTKCKKEGTFFPALAKLYHNLSLTGPQSALLTDLFSMLAIDPKEQATEWLAAATACKGKLVDYAQTLKTNGETLQANFGNRDSGEIVDSQVTTRMKRFSDTFGASLSRMYNKLSIYDAERSMLASVLSLLVSDPKTSQKDWLGAAKAYMASAVAYTETLASIKAALKDHASTVTGSFTDELQEKAQQFTARIPALCSTLFLSTGESTLLRSVFSLLVIDPKENPKEWLDTAALARTHLLECVATLQAKGAAHQEAGKDVVDTTALDTLPDLAKEFDAVLSRMYHKLSLSDSEGALLRSVFAILVADPKADPDEWIKAAGTTLADSQSALGALQAHRAALEPHQATITDGVDGDVLLKSEQSLKGVLPELFRKLSLAEVQSNLAISALKLLMIDSTSNSEGWAAGVAECKAKLEACNAAIREATTKIIDGAAVSLENPFAEFLISFDEALDRLEENVNLSVSQQEVILALRKQVEEQLETITDLQDRLEIPQLPAVSVTLITSLQGRITAIGEYLVNAEVKVLVGKNGGQAGEKTNPFKRMIPSIAEKITEILESRKQPDTQKKAQALDVDAKSLFAQKETVEPLCKFLDGLVERGIIHSWVVTKAGALCIKVEDKDHGLQINSAIPATLATVGWRDGAALQKGPITELPSIK
ncbi:MAG: hypothetical protein HKM07_03755 [Chlamydiae bacterium]|nr:hypothetical protein [Chlamydiota bacterium]